MPLCQDTGSAVLFVDLGQEVLLTGGDFNEAINGGSGRVTGRVSCGAPLFPIPGEVNTGDNTPAIVQLRIVPGGKIKLTLAPKGRWQ